MYLIHSRRRQVFLPLVNVDKFVSNSQAFVAVPGLYIPAGVFVLPNNQVPGLYIPAGAFFSPKMLISHRFPGSCGSRFMRFRFEAVRVQPVPLIPGSNRFPFAGSGSVRKLPDF